MAHRFKGIPKQKARTLDGPKEIADHRERAALDASVIDGRPTRLVDSPLN
jgi:hypothetical protein